MINLPQDGVRLIFDPVVQRLKVIYSLFVFKMKVFNFYECLLNVDSVYSFFYCVFQIIEIYNMKMTKLKYWYVIYLFYSHNLNKIISALHDLPFLLF